MSSYVSGPFWLSSNVPEVSDLRVWLQSDEGHICKYDVLRGHSRHISFDARQVSTFFVLQLLLFTLLPLSLA